MKREWNRPVAQDEDLSEHECSQKAIVVIIFWTLFEHLMNQLFQTVLAKYPAGVRQDLLRRYQSVGSRMDRLYSMLFATTMFADWDKLGFSKTHEFLKRIQSSRNDFIHGKAEAISDELVRETFERIDEVQLAWIAVFNLRCAGDSNAPPVSEERSTLGK
jgi:hypothetical protein